MIGCYIIDEFYDYFKNYNDSICKPSHPISIENIWLLIASFHDIAIPIQKKNSIEIILIKEYFPR